MESKDKTENQEDLSGLESIVEEAKQQEEQAEAKTEEAEFIPKDSDDVSASEATKKLLMGISALAAKRIDPIWAMEEEEADVIGGGIDGCMKAWLPSVGPIGPGATLLTGFFAYAGPRLLIQFNVFGSEEDGDKPAKKEEDDGEK